MIITGKLAEMLHQDILWRLQKIATLQVIRDYAEDVEFEEIKEPKQISYELSKEMVD